MILEDVSIAKDMFFHLNYMTNCLRRIIDNLLELGSFVEMHCCGNAICSLIDGSIWESTYGSPLK